MNFNFIPMPLLDINPLKYRILLYADEKLLATGIWDLLDNDVLNFDLTICSNCTCKRVLNFRQFNTYPL